MDENEAIELAGRKAAELNIPWAGGYIRAFRRKIWPFPGVWNIVCEAPLLETTVTTHLLVFEGTSQVSVGGTVFRSQHDYAHHKDVARRRALGVLRFAVEIMACGALLGLLARYVAGGPTLLALLVGLAGALPSAVAFRVLMGRKPIPRELLDP